MVEDNAPFAPLSTTSQSHFPDRWYPSKLPGNDAGHHNPLPSSLPCSNGHGLSIRPLTSMHAASLATQTRCVTVHAHWPLRVFSCFCENLMSKEQQGFSLSSSPWPGPTNF